MGDSPQEMDDSATIALTGKIVVVGVASLLFFIIIFVLFLHLYARFFWYPPGDESAPPTLTPSAAEARRIRRRRRLEFAPDHLEWGLRSGLDPSVLKSLPVGIFSNEDFKEGLECPVCISDFEEGEKVRLLPKCNHGFHLDCIDMWFKSHSTCPLCRNPVSTQSSGASQLTLESILHTLIPEDSADSRNFPTDNAAVGSLEEGSSRFDSYEFACSSSSLSSDGMLVIDIPREVDEEEEAIWPTTETMEALTRHLRRERQVNRIGDPSVDAEQVQGS